MQSRLRGSRAAFVFFLAFLLSLHSRAQQTAPAATDKGAEDASAAHSMTPQEIVDANALDKEGKRPFHLKESFQVFDLDGKPGEQGTLEYWWAGPAGTRMEVTSPSVGTVHSFRLDALPSSAARRTIYLVMGLLSDTLHPGVMLGLPRAHVETKERVNGTLILECMHPVLPPTRFGPVEGTEVCADSKSGTIRLINAADHVVDRNKLGTFAGTRVALDEAIRWGRFPSLTAQIEQLQTFDPSQGNVVLEQAKSAEQAKATPPSSVRLGSGVIAGQKIGGATPRYPAQARIDRVQGTVIMMAEISEEGHITNLAPLASPDSALTRAATDAVSTWTYRPYLLNGVPTRVETTITVNFNLR